MEIDTVPPVMPVIQQVRGVDQLPDVGPGMNATELLPPLHRDQLAKSVGRLVPGQAGVANARDQCRQGNRQDGQRCQTQATG